MTSSLELEEIFPDDPVQRSLMAEDILVHPEGVYRGIKYSLKRNPILGNWCGYVHLDRPADSDELELLSEASHGGLTYEDDNKFVYGFDCAHHGDYWGPMTSGGVYRDRDFALTTVKRMILFYVSFV